MGRERLNAYSKGEREGNDARLMEKAGAGKAENDKKKKSQLLFNLLTKQKAKIRVMQCRDYNNC